MRQVYFDVENTLEVPFITGIQRVTREFAKIVLNPNFDDSEFAYVPVLYDLDQRKWRCLTRYERSSLLSSAPRKLDTLSKLVRKMRGLWRKPHYLFMDEFAPDSVFLDIESSWHANLGRDILLPALKKQGIKIVKVHFDIIPLKYPKITHPNTRKVFIKHFASHVNFADLFLCISQNTVSDVTQYCQNLALPVPKMKRIDLGVSLDTICHGSKFDQDTTQFQKYGKYILSVGTLEPRKNFNLLIEAFNELSKHTELNLVIAGKKGWMAEELYQSLYDHPEFETRLWHLDDVSDSQLDGLYRNAWLAVVPSIYEGFGLPAVESLARDCATICSRGGALTEIGDHYVSYFSPENKDELIKLIRHLSSNSSDYEKLKSAARKFQPTSWFLMVSQISNALTEI